MNLAQLQAWAVAHKTQLLVGGGVGAAGLALAAKHKAAKTGAGATSAGPATPFVPAGTGAYDSTSSDVYNKLQGQYDQMQGQLAALTAAGGGGGGWSPSDPTGVPAAVAPAVTAGVDPAPVPPRQPSSPVMPALPTGPAPAPTTRAVPTRSATRKPLIALRRKAAAAPKRTAPKRTLRQVLTRKPATEHVRTAPHSWPRISGLLRLTPSRLQRGTDVATVQRQLISRGFSPGKVDGIFGVHTNAAVRSFQSRNHLVVDGIVGPKTAAALGLGYGTRPPPVTHAPAHRAPKPAPKPARPHATPAHVPLPKRVPPPRQLPRPAPKRLTRA